MLENQTDGNRRFAVVDLEASSTKPRNRIIEIAVLILEDDGYDLVLKDSFSTLVNPEVEVPTDILELTGITKEELDIAPKFFEIAEDLEMYTRDCTIVAHNVEFDIALLQEEFEKLGTELLRKTKCTLALAKEHYAELGKYDLKSLCQILEIDLAFNHRAMDDAVACAELFQKTYYESKGTHPEDGPSLTKLRKVHPGLDLGFYKDLKPTPGLVHFSSEGETILVERFENLTKDVPRYIERFVERYERTIDDLQITPFKDALIAMREKEDFIFKLNPEINLEKRNNSWGVFLKENPFSLKAYPLFKGQGDLLFISQNKDDAIYWIKLQLDDVEKQEFAYIDQQDHKLINRLKKEREKTIRAKVRCFATYPHDHFVVMGPGRDDDELSCHFFSGGKLNGHAFISGQAVFDLDSAPKSLKPAKETEILKHYFLREFQDWKTRSLRSHSIKQLKSAKMVAKENLSENSGNLIKNEPPSSGGHRKKGKKKHHRHKNSKSNTSNNRKNFKRKGPRKKNTSKPSPSS